MKTQENVILSKDKDASSVGKDILFIAGDKAFSWENEFPQVFVKGGFDLVIGSAPYGVSFNEVEKYLAKFDHLVPDFENLYLLHLTSKRYNCEFNILLTQFCFQNEKRP